MKTHTFKRQGRELHYTDAMLWSQTQVALAAHADPHFLAVHFQARVKGKDGDVTSALYLVVDTSQKKWRVVTPPAVPAAPAPTFALAKLAVGLSAEIPDTAYTRKIAGVDGFPDTEGWTAVIPEGVWILEKNQSGVGFEFNAGPFHEGQGVGAWRQVGQDVIERLRRIS